MAALQVTVTGLGEQIRATEWRAKAARDLKPALKQFTTEAEVATQRAFSRSVSPDGEAFKPLAPSTVEARARASKGARKRDEFGDLTPRAEKIRATIRAAGGTTPLIDSGRLRNSCHWLPPKNDSVEFSMLDYGVPHVTGGKRNGHAAPPKRNFTVFLKNGDSWELLPQYAELFREIILAYVATPKVA